MRGGSLGRIDAENVARGPVQPDVTEIAGLLDQSLVVEEQSDAVGRVIALRLDAHRGTTKLISG